MRASPWSSSLLRRAAAAAAVAAAYIALVALVIAPLHARGVAQPLASYLCGLGHLLEVPGRTVADEFVPTVRHHVSAQGWILSLALNGAFYFCAAMLIGIVLRRPAAAAAPATPTPGAKGGLSRRKFLRAGAAGVLGCGAAAAGYALLVEPRRIAITRRLFPLRGLPPELAGLRAVQLTDIHLGPWISIEYVREAVRMANDLEPDIILLTGDYVHRSPAYFAPAVEALKELRARIGIVGVLGNHDWWEGGGLARSAFERAGLPLIDNSRLFVTPGRKLAAEAAAGLCIAGVGDLWEDAVNFRAALGGVPAEMPRLLLSHNPDAAEERDLIRGGHRVDLMLSGHTHGGQVRLPLLGTPIVPSRFGQKYARGLVEGPACPVHVCAGIGMTVLPLRFGVRPEIALIELAPA